VNALPVNTSFTPRRNMLLMLVRGQYQARFLVRSPCSRWDTQLLQTLRQRSHANSDQAQIRQLSSLLTYGPACNRPSTTFFSSTTIIAKCDEVEFKY